MVLAPLLNPKFAFGLWARVYELRVRGASVRQAAWARIFRSPRCEAREELLRGRFKVARRHSD
jgi:hypothetical protein